MKLVAKELVKTFKKRNVVNGASFEVEKGQIIGLLGPNGAGKTTSFYMMVGLIFPDSGQVFLGDKAITSYSIHIRSKMGIGYLPQEKSIFRKMTARDNIYSIAQTRSDLTKTQQNELTDRLLEEFKITHIADSMAISLSGGECRRVEIARALALEPSFLLLDEPFAGIDPVSVNDIQGIIRQLADREIGILITDHNVRETLTICHHAYVLNEGRVFAQGSASEILHNKEVQRVYLGNNFIN